MKFEYADRAEIIEFNNLTSGDLFLFPKDESLLVCFAASSANASAMGFDWKDLTIVLGSVGAKVDAKVPYLIYRHTLQAKWVIRINEVRAEPRQEFPADPSTSPMLGGLTISGDDAYVQVSDGSRSVFVNLSTGEAIRYISGETLSFARWRMSFPNRGFKPYFLACGATDDL